MIKTSIEIDNLVHMENRRVELPEVHFSETIAFLINDFAKKNNVSIEEVLKDVNEVLEIIKKYK